MRVMNRQWKVMWQAREKTKQIQKLRDWNEADREEAGVVSRERVTHIESYDQLFVVN